MKSQVQKLFLFLTICILTSCSTQINFNDYIDKNAPLDLFIYKNDSVTGLTSMEQQEISVNSIKFNMLTKWADNNTRGWHSTYDSYNAEVSILQGDFRLLYWTGGAGVVIGFTDKKNKSRQFSKKIRKGELDFLL